MTRVYFLSSALVLVCVVYVVLSCLPKSSRQGAGIVPVLSNEEVENLLKEQTTEELLKAREKLRPLHEKLGPPQPGDWLNSHPERGQTFEEYLQCSPIRPTKERGTIYIQPLGDFTKGQRKVVERTAEFISLYFNLPVKIKKDIPLSVVPPEARRFHPTWRDKNNNRIPQILTGYVMKDILLPKLPEDAVSYIAFTAIDLWPGPNWNFVFGQANLVRRVGVWSIYRFGNPDGGETEFRKTLLRTMKTGTHELGHMFTILHCIEYECNMCGSNNLSESDRRPPWLCPECVCKVCWATGTDMVARYNALAKFCGDNGFKREQEFYEKSIKELTSSKK